MTVPGVSIREPALSKLKKWMKQDTQDNAGTSGAFPLTEGKYT